MEGFIGTILPVGFNFAPRGWYSCEGQLLSIAQNSAMFSLLGVTYGGDGRTTFALPDLRGRRAIGQGQGPNLKNYQQGQASGTESVSITVNNMPAHNHAVTVNANQIEQNSNDAQNNYFGGGAANNVYTATAPDVQMNPAVMAASAAGSSVPVGNLSPYLAMYYCICYQGIFPSRN